VTGCRDRIQQESQRAIYLDCMFLDLPKAERVATPLLVIGAEHDGFFTVDEIHSTATAYGTEAEIFPGMGHNMMVEPGWRDVAERIAAWLDSTLTPRRS
jgi:alpha-beta hydrolase superfamily lysophospholipase